MSASSRALFKAIPRGFLPRTPPPSPKRWTATCSLRGMQDLGKALPTWGSSVRGSAGVIQPTLSDLADGTLLAYLRRGPRDNQRRIRRAVSRDGGRTWTPAEATPLPNPNSAIDVARLRSGHLALAFNNSPTDRT